MGVGEGLGEGLGDGLGEGLGDGLGDGEGDGLGEGEGVPSSTRFLRWICHHVLHRTQVVPAKVAPAVRSPFSRHFSHSTATRPNSPPLVWP